MQIPSVAEEMQAAAGEPATSETARNQNVNIHQIFAEEPTTELDPRSATPLLSEELTAFEKAPKGPKRQTISTSVPDF